MVMIAGHNFCLGTQGNKCSNEHYDAGVTTTCLVCLEDVLSATRDDIGKLGFACRGTLSTAEYNEIEHERERIWGALKS